MGNIITNKPPPIQKLTNYEKSTKSTKLICAETRSIFLLLEPQMTILKPLKLKATFEYFFDP